MDRVETLEQDYVNAGFDGRLAFGSTPVLLLVDIVVAYLDQKSPLYASPFTAAFDSALRLTEHARATGIPVIFTNVVYQADGIDGGLFYRKVPALRHYLRGSPLGEFDDRLKPLKNELVVTKQYASAFFGTSLASTLHTLNADTVVIAGFSTSGCVRASALDALQCGFAPFVVRDACGDRDANPHRANLFDLQAKYAEVISEAEALQFMRLTDA